MVLPSAPLTPLNSKLPQVVHGLSIPLGKVGYHLPRTLSGAIGDSDESGPSRNSEAVANEEGRLEEGRTRRIRLESDVNKTEKQEPVGISVPLTVRRMGGTIMEGT